MVGKFSGSYRRRILAACAFAACLLPRSAQAQDRSDFGGTRSLVPAFSTSRGSGALGDFDGDHLADVAVATPQGVVNGAYRYRVDVHLTSEPGTTFDVDSDASGGLHISARDVDGDHDLDLVVTSAFGREPLGVWINDGHGHFTEGTAADYSPSVWQDSDRSFEAPARLRTPALPFVYPTGGSVLQQARSSVLLPARNLPLRATAPSPSQRPLKPGSPPRAPPLH